VEGTTTKGARPFQHTDRTLGEKREGLSLVLLGGGKGKKKVVDAYRK